MTTSRAQQALIDQERRRTVRDYHRALDDAIRDAEAIADLIPPQDLARAAKRLAAAAAGVQDLINVDDHQAAHHIAIEAAGEALGIAATLTTRKDT